MQALGSRLLGPSIAPPSSSSSRTRARALSRRGRVVLAVGVAVACVVAVSVVAVLTRGTGANARRGGEGGSVGRRGAASDVPSQIHIAQGDAGGTSVVVSWATQHETGGEVVLNQLGSRTTKTIPQDSSGRYSYQYLPKYKRANYTSPVLHHATLAGLKPNTVYQYRCGSQGAGYSESFNFTVWGSDATDASPPFVIGFVGDLGQTEFSESTRDHLIATTGKRFPTFLVGDLSYADSEGESEPLHNCTQARWDSWGQLMQPLAASSPLMVLPGNHEVEYNSEVASQTPFLAYQKRFRTSLWGASAGTEASSLFYSFNVPRAHVVFLNSYDGPSFDGPYDASSAQYKWLEADLAAVNRTKFPWIIAGLHAPWYNSNTHHHDESQEVNMRKALEPLLRKYAVDLMFAGHVHAYERMFPVYNNVTTVGATTFINIGDGGNREGPAIGYYPQPSWSAFRDIAFGHGVLTLHNSTHAHWVWHKNSKAVPVVSDEVWLVKNAFLGTAPTGVTALTASGRVPARFDGRRPR